MGGVAFIFGEVGGGDGGPPKARRLAASIIRGECNTQELALQRDAAWATRNESGNADDDDAAYVATYANPTFAEATEATYADTIYTSATYAAADATAADATYTARDNARKHQARIFRNLFPNPFRTPPAERNH